MNNIQRNPNERGSAILLVLGFLSLLLMMAMIFATTGRNAQIVADAKADETNAQLQSRSAVTQGQEAVFFLQNKGNILGSTDTDLQDCLPENIDIEQSPTELDSEANYTLNKKGKELYYGTTGDINDKLLGVQPYVGYTTDQLPTSWRFLAFYGELAKDASTSTPFGITTTNPYQSIYYSHHTDAAALDNYYDEVAKQGENSLYEIVKATPLGNLYFEACQDPVNTSLNHFEELLKNNIATQLQFRNFFQEDPEDHSEHVFSRQGFIMFNEGSKFDVNRLVSPKMKGEDDEPYVPFIGGDGTVPEELGVLTLGAPGTGLNIDVKPGRSTFAIMGRKYNSGEYTSDALFTTIEEDLTLQYGLHPAELQTRIVGSDIVYEKSLTRKKNDMPARWFNYEQLIGNDDTKDEIKKDIFTLGVECGVDDRELRFNGQYANMPELLASIGTTIDTDGDGNRDALELTADGKIASLETKNSYLAKTNVAFPWGLYCTEATCQLFDASLGTTSVTWDTIGKKLSAVANENTLKNYAKHFFVNHLGLNYDPSDAKKIYLFKDGSNDKTLDVFANLTDFCDSDYAATYLATYNGSNRLAFNTASLAVAPQSNAIPANKTTKEPTLCGNERVPAIVGVNVSIEAKSGTTITNQQNNTHMLGAVLSSKKAYTYRATVNAGNLVYTPRVTLSLQNFFNETLDKTNQKYRVIVKGRIQPILLAKKVYVRHYTAAPATTHYCETQYGNAMLFLGSSSTMDAVQTTSSFAGNTNSTDYGLNNGSENSSVLSRLKTNGWNFQLDQTFNVDRTSFAPLENQSVELVFNDMTVAVQKQYSNNATSYPQEIPMGNNYYYYCTGTGYAVQIEKIEVLVHNNECDGAADVSELVYAETGSGNAELSVVYASKGNENYQDGNLNYYNPNGSATLANYATLTGITCKDPRMNHLNNQWIWFINHPMKSNSSYFDNTSTTYCYRVQDGEKGLVREGITRSAAGSAARQSTLAKLSLYTVQQALQYTNGAAKDWEPDFNPGNMVPAASGSYYKSTMANTVSTYFIPNSPISSLWQLGAIHRGKEGQTLNLKSFGLSDDTNKRYTYSDGDAWILDYLKLNELNPNSGIRGKFNPNCFNRGAYRYLFANIPANPDANDTMIYANGFYDPDTTEVKRNTYFTDYIDATKTGGENLEEKVFRFKDYTQVSGADGILAAQSWSPVQAFFNFVEVDGGIGTSSVRTGTAPTTFQCNDRQAESLIGCTAGLLSTRYEVFTVIAVGQSVKYIMNAEDMDNMMTANDVDKTNASERKDFLNKHFVSPIEIDFEKSSTKYREWYSILSTQVREVTFVRDCWFGKIKVLKSRLL